MEIEKSIIIRKCTVNDVDSIYDIQNIVIDNFKEEEKYSLTNINKNLNNIFLFCKNGDGSNGRKYSKTIN